MKGKGIQLLLKKNKKLIIAASLLASLAIGETLAWSNPSVSVVNELKAHKTEVTVEEEFEQDEQDPAKYKKQVSFHNTGDSDVFVRMSYEEYWTYEKDGEKYQISNKINDEELAKKIFDGGNNTPSKADWEKKGDGWYYYNKVLPAGETIRDVLKSVEINKELLEKAGYKDHNLQYYLYFKVETVQASTSLENKTLNRDEVNKKATETVFRTFYGEVDFKTAGPEYSVTWYPVTSETVSGSGN